VFTQALNPIPFLGEMDFEIGGFKVSELNNTIST
jgi:hypothetical protein